MTLINDYLPLLLRICLVVLFPFSALDKIVNWGSAMKQAGNGALAPAMLAAAIAVEALCPACIVLGWHDRLAAFVLAGFCAVTAVLYHQFWRYPDFWRFREGEGLQHFWKHCQLVALGSCWSAIGVAYLQLRRSGDAADLGPKPKGPGPGGSILDGWNVVAAEMEEVVDPVVSGEEPLCLAG